MPRRDRKVPAKKSRMAEGVHTSFDEGGGIFLSVPRLIGDASAREGPSLANIPLTSLF